MARPRLLRVPLALALVASAALACDDAGTGTQDGGITGTYTLVSVNGSPIPAVVYEEPGYTEEVLSGSLTLLSDNTFSGTVLYRTSEEGNVMTETEGGTETYTVSGNQITFIEEDETTIGVIDGERITVTVEEDEEEGRTVLVFEK